MSKKTNKNDQSTTITTRIDIVAKNIINRGNKSYRQILEKDAYSSVTENKDEIIIHSNDEIKSITEDISQIDAMINHNNKEIEWARKIIEGCEKSNKSLKAHRSDKEKRLSEIQQDMDNLKQVVETYEDNISYGINDAVKKVEETLKHNHDLRQLAPRARVKESEIKRICQIYKVKVSEVISEVDPKYLDCMEGYQKYI